MNKRLKGIRDEIKWYEPKKRIADAMLALGELGFAFSGHGVGYGQEDFGLVCGEWYFNFSDNGKKIVASVNNGADDVADVEFQGTIGQAMKFITKRLAA